MEFTRLKIIEFYTQEYFYFILSYANDKYHFEVVSELPGLLFVFFIYTEDSEDDLVKRIGLISYNYGNTFMKIQVDEKSKYYHIVYIF